jgi:hypothetical protein
MTNPLHQRPALRRSETGTWRPFFLSHPRLVPDGETRLAAGELVSLDPRAGLLIDCCEGTAWITQAGEPADFVARAGDEFVPGPRGRVVIQAMSAVRLRVSTATAGRPVLYARRCAATSHS